MVDPNQSKAYLRSLLLLYALALPLSIAVAEPLVFLTVPFFLLGFRGTTFSLSRSSSPYVLWVLAFAAWATLSLFWSTRPGLSASKLHRLLTLTTIGSIPFAFGGRGSHEEVASRSVTTAVRLFVLGATLLSVYDIFRIPQEVLQGTPIYDTGNMRDPQFYLISICFLTAFQLQRITPRERAVSWLGLLLNVVGLVLHFKRGVWLSALLALTSMGCLARRWKLLGALALVVIMVCLLPEVQKRLYALSELTNVSVGGRTTLWMQVGPALFKEYPMGMGWKAVKHEDLAAHSDYLQPGLDHLHNSAFQVLLELGWVGVSIWLGWMVQSFRVLFQVYRTSRAQVGDEMWLCLGCLGGFIGLMTNGLVENNFGDTEILMMFCFIMGLSATLRSKLSVERLRM